MILDTPVSSSSSSSSRQLIIGIVAVTALIFAGLVWLVMRAPSGGPIGESEVGKPEKVNFSDEKDPVIGPLNAQVIVRMYGDFQCPACRAAEAGVKPTIQKYSDRVRFVWKDFPLAQIHKNALLAANAARCAQVQGWFWKFHDRLFEKQSEWTSSTDPTQAFQTYALEVEANGEKFNKCLANKEESVRVAADIAEGGGNAVDATPTFFVNNVRYNGMSPDQWSKVLDKALAEAGAATAATSTNPS